MRISGAHSSQFSLMETYPVKPGVSRVGKGEQAAPVHRVEYLEYHKEAPENRLVPRKSSPAVKPVESAQWQHTSGQRKNQYHRVWPIADSPLGQRAVMAYAETERFAHEPHQTEIVGIDYYA